MGEDADAPVPFRVAGAELLPPEVHLALVGPQPSGQDPKKGGLPCSIGAEDGHQLARAQLEPYAVHRSEGPELPHQPGCRENGPGPREVARRTVMWGNVGGCLHGRPEVLYSAPGEPGDCKGVPHSEQNLLPPGLGCPHSEQNTPPLRRARTWRISSSISASPCR